MPTRVLITTLDVVGERMAGPAIRAWELAGQLATTCEVTLASKFPVGRSSDRFAAVRYAGERELLALARKADVVVVQGFMLYDHPALARTATHLVVDMYDPLVFESYPQYLARGAGGRDLFRRHLDALDQQMLAGHFFLCASERQRDMWLGRFCALGRLVPELVEADPGLSRFLAVVPFGLPDAPPGPAGGPAIRGVVPGIGPDDCVLLWGGGVWDWFDPLTVIRAVAKVGSRRDDVKLFFLGCAHPNPETPAMAMTARAFALAEELGVKDRLVHFNPGWVPYERRAAYLAEADAGVSAHFDAVETRFSFRTRVLDYLWAGLPVLSTTGDAMGELVGREGLGEVLPYEDVDAWVAAIARLADDPARRAAIRARVAQAAEGFRWSRVAGPLVAYCQAPWLPPAGLRPAAPPPARPLATARAGWRVLAAEGPAAFIRKARAKLGHAPAPMAGGTGLPGDRSPGQ